MGGVPLTPVQRVGRTLVDFKHSRSRGPRRFGHRYIQKTLAESFSDLVDHLKKVLPDEPHDARMDAIVSELFYSFIDDDGHVKTHRLPQFVECYTELKARREWTSKAKVVGTVSDTGINAVAKLLVYLRRQQWLAGEA